MGPTFRLGKQRVYQCTCGAKPVRPLRAKDTTALPFPKPCDRCGESLADRPFSIEDAKVWLRDRLTKPEET
jgi:hypothetical protein